MSTDTSLTKNDPEDMASALDAALDELDEDHDVPQPPPSRRRPLQGPSPPPAQDDPLHELQQFLAQTLPSTAANQRDVSMNEEDVSPDAFLQQFMQEMQSQMQHLEQQQQTPSTSKQAAANPKSSSSQTTKNATKNQTSEVNQVIEALVEDMKQPPEEALDDDDGDSSHFLDGDPESMLKNLFQTMNLSDDSPHDSEATDRMVQEMMKELLAKDLMYEPMQQVAQKFPAWLEGQKSSMNEDEYQKRCQQRDLFAQLVQVYETEPENTTRLMELMQEVQDYGQPPAEIIQDIAPGLTMDANGMPQDCCIM